MGGINSGRHRTRNRGNVEGAIVLDLRVFRRRGFILPGQVTNGTLRSTGGTNAPWAAVWELDLQDPLRGVLLVSHLVEDEVQRQRVSLASSPRPYGGRQYYLVCPATGDRVMTLALVDGVFVGRRAARLTYASQSEAPVFRLARARDKARARALGQGGNPKPRGQRRERLEARWIDLEEASERVFTAEAARRFGGGEGVGLD